MKRPTVSNFVSDVPRRPPFYRGWFVLGASAIVELLVQGATSYSAGLFVLPLQAEFHISRANANSTVLLLFIGTMALSPIAGRLLDRLPLRLAMIIGVIALCGSFALISVLQSLWIMALLIVLPAAFGFMILGPLNTSTLAARWFSKNRGLAMGIAAVATSGGGLLVTPLLAHAIASQGWRQSLLLESAIIGAIVFALTFSVIRDRPTDVFDQQEPKYNRQIPTAVEIPHWKDIMACRSFWIPSLPLAVIASVSQAIVITLVPYGVELGMSPARAALSISIFSSCAAITKIAAGILSDKISKRAMLIVATAVAAISQLVLWSAGSETGIDTGAGLMGIALGIALPTAGNLISEQFSPAAFGTVMGLTYMLTSGLAIATSRFIGFSYDHYRSYGAGFITFLGATTVALLVSSIKSAPRSNKSVA